MQSLGEDLKWLQKAPYELDLLKIARLYQRGLWYRVYVGQGG
jgi:6-phosphogluconate dehydrogenase (decarboxylating)